MELFILQALLTFKQTHTCEQSYFHLTGQTVFSTKATRTLCFSFIFTLVLWILNRLLFNVRCIIFHFFHVIVKICVVFVVELNLRAILVKYGRELTHMHPLQIGKNISTWISNYMFPPHVRCCHIPIVLRACKNLCCICGGTNREVLPLKYGREFTLTRYMHPLHNTTTIIKHTPLTKNKNKPTRTCRQHHCGCKFHWSYDCSYIDYTKDEHKDGKTGIIFPCLAGKSCYVLLRLFLAIFEVK